MITPLKAGEPIAKNWRTINEVAAGLEALRDPNSSRDGAIAGLRGRPKDAAGAAGPYTTYDKSRTYYPGDDVSVPPAHELVTDGLLDEETETVLKAPAGLYRCQRLVAPVVIDPEADPLAYRYNAPKWPLETADDVEATNTFWMLTALWPDTTKKCVDGEEVDVYANTQPVPEQPE